MTIAIHHRKGSFSDIWISYCEEKKIPYRIVNAFDNDIIKQVSGCSIFLWHHHHAKYKDVMTAKRILFALQQSGVKTYPDFSTGWHFDDKIAQKYLLESINAPLVPSYIFYDKSEALSWASNTNYPKVFKLKGGAGATNVKLVTSSKNAKEFIQTAFSNGFSQFNNLENLRDNIKLLDQTPTSWKKVAKSLTRFIIKSEFLRYQPNERGYIYFQEFVPNNNYDTRVVVIGNKFAAAEKRFVRSNDFRASGSGIFSYEGIDIEVIKTAFQVSKQLDLQSVAFDFILNEKKEPLIIEMSYAFGTEGITEAPGYWDAHLNWVPKPFKPQQLILESLLEDI